MHLCFLDLFRLYILPLLERQDKGEEDGIAHLFTSPETALFTSP